MGAFGGLILTNKGRNLQAKAQTGVQLNFTKIKIGDGSLSGQSIVDLTNLISTKKELTILSLETLTGGKAKLRSYFTNADIVTGFYWRELGVFAQDPDEGEILYCYGNAGTNAEYIPAGGGPDVVERYINVITLVGNATNVSATLGSEIYVTQADFDNHTGNTVIHVTQTEKDTWNAKETPAGAQAKADVAEAAANAYTDQKVGDLAGAGRTTETVKGNADALAAHLADTAPHGATSAATANTIIMRDASGRAKVAAPSASDDIARKDTVDVHANRTDNPHLTTAAQVGALVSVDGVSNAGGNIDLAAGSNIVITPDNTNKKITIGGTGTWPNADTVDGYHVGNASGQIPVSNGIENINLNAAMVNGKHAAEIPGAKIITLLAPDFYYYTTSTTVGNNIVKAYDSGSSPPTVYLNNYKFLWQAALTSGRTVYFEAIISSAASAQTAYVALKEISSGTLHGQMSVTGVAATRVRSGALTLPDNTELCVSLWSNTSSYSAQLLAARLIII